MSNYKYAAAWCVDVDTIGHDVGITFTKTRKVGVVMRKIIENYRHTIENACGRTIEEMLADDMDYYDILDTGVVSMVDIAFQEIPSNAQEV